MLTIKRRIGEALLVGDRRVELISITGNAATLSISGPDGTTFKEFSDIVEVWEGVKIGAQPYSADRSKIAIEAPKEVQVKREEMANG